MCGTYKIVMYKEINFRSLVKKKQKVSLIITSHIATLLVWLDVHAM